MSDYGGMRCEVVRETLSSLLDGEQQELPAQQVDAHLASCRGCRRWLVGAAAQARRLTDINSDTGGDYAAGNGPDLAAQILAAAGVTSVTAENADDGLWSRWGFRRPALIAVGVFQVAMALAQIAGVDFGMVSAHGHGHGAATGAHLLHESTAWLLALGGAMIAAGIWPSAAAGVAAITGVYALALGGYVAIDAYHGQVTTARIVSHLPVLVGLLFALLVARERTGGTGSSAARSAADAPPPADGGRSRRGRHLRSINRSVSPTTMRRRSAGVPGLGWAFMAGVDRGDDDAVTALAVAAAAGDAGALEGFIKATQHDVWRFVAYLFDGVSADDLTQETFLRAIGAIGRFAGRSSARTWLLSIARRVVADHIRYLKSRPRTAPGADPELLLDRDRPARGFEDVVEVTALIAGLSADQREALLLTQLFGLSYSDAAAVCGCPVGTIRSRVARARDALLADPERGELTG